MKDGDEIVQTLDKIKFYIFAELESLIKIHTLPNSNEANN